MSSFVHQPGRGPYLWATVPSVEVGGSKNVAASTFEPANHILYAYGHLFGNAANHSSGTQPAAVRLQFTDAVKVTGSTNNYNGLLVRLTSSTGAEGLRSVIQAQMAVTGTFDGVVSDYLAHVAGLFLGFSTANQAGTGGGDPDDYRGGLFGMNANVWLASGATHYHEIVGSEVDIAIMSGANAFDKLGWLIVQGSIDVNQADPEGDDAAIAIANQEGAGTFWRDGLLLGKKSAKWPFGNTSTLINARPQSLGCSPCDPAPVLRGIDFSQLSIDAAGYAMISPGFSVGPAGELLHIVDVVADADGRTISAAESGTTFTNEGATGRDDFTLPDAVAGLTYRFVVQDSDGIRVIAATGDTIRVGALVSGAAGRIDNATIGSVVELVAINATEWYATATVGTWVPT